MTMQEIREYLKNKINLEISNLKFSTNRTGYVYGAKSVNGTCLLNKLTVKDLGKIVSIFLECKIYIDSKYHSKLMEQLLLNFMELDCCCISSLPKSPCYIGKMASSIPIRPMPKKELYRSYRRGGTKVLIAP